MLTSAGWLAAWVCMAAAAAADDDVSISAGWLFVTRSKRCNHVMFWGADTAPVLSAGSAACSI